MSIAPRVLCCLALLGLVATGGPAATAAAAPTADLEARGAAAFAARDWATTRQAYEELLAAQPGSALARFRMGVARLYLGELAAGLADLDAAEALGWALPQVAYRKACAHAAAGRLDAAERELRRAAQAGFAQLALADGDSLLAALRADPRWAPLRAELDRAAHPCLYDARYRAFDFWAGTWDVVPNGAPPGTPPAENVVTREYDGCVIHEHWRSPSSAGESFNIYDASRGAWFQTWVDNGGGLHQYQGNPDADGHMVFTTDLQYAPGEERRPTRLTFFRRGADEVRQLSERSADGGRTWTVNYDLIYRRRPQPPG